MLRAVTNFHIQDAMDIAWAMRCKSRRTQYRTKERKKERGVLLRAAINFQKGCNGRGCTGEFSCMKVKKKFWFYVRKKNRSKKNVTKHNSCHPQNRRFPLSTMVANIHLRSLFCDVNIPSSRLK